MAQVTPIVGTGASRSRAIRALARFGRIGGSFGVIGQ
jgi:hypothetical protein